MSYMVMVEDENSSLSPLVAVFRIPLRSIIPLPEVPEVLVPDVISVKVDAVVVLILSIVALQIRPVFTCHHISPVNTVSTVRNCLIAEDAVLLIFDGSDVDVLNNTALPNPPTGP